MGGVTLDAKQNLKVFLPLLSQPSGKRTHKIGPAPISSGIEMKGRDSHYPMRHIGQEALNSKVVLGGYKALNNTSHVSKKKTEQNTEHKPCTVENHCGSAKFVLEAKTSSMAAKTATALGLLLASAHKHDRNTST